MSKEFTMFKKLLAVSFVLFLAVVMLSSCAKAPLKAVEATKAALADAKTKQIDSYFPAEFKSLEDSLTLALAEIETQATKSAFSRNYQRAQGLLDQVNGDLRDLGLKIDARKEEVKAQVTQKIIDLEYGVEDALNLLQKTNKNKDTRPILDGLQTDISLVKVSINDITKLIDAQDYVAAQAKAVEGLTKLDTITAQLNELGSKYGRKK